MLTPSVEFIGQR